MQCISFELRQSESNEEPSNVCMVWLRGLKVLQI